MSVWDALEAHGITPPKRTVAKQRCPCPQCGKGKADQALALHVSGAQAMWYCHRCNWKGHIRGGTMPPDHRAAKAQPASNAPVATVLGGREWLLWQRGVPISPDDHAGRYLRARRCVIPGSHVVRYLPDHWASVGQSAPCIMSLITHVYDMRPMSLHFTYVGKDGDGRKAKVDRPRRLLRNHSKMDGVIRLSPDHEVESGLVIGEGLETCLSIMHSIRPVWCVIDSGNLGAFPVLAGVEALTILVDHDEAGMRGADRCQDRWMRAGRQVRRLCPPAIRTDINDMIMRHDG